MFFLFGFGTKQQLLGPGETRTCPRCANTTQWELVRQYKQLSVFFIPIARWGRRRFETCPVCGTSLEIA